MRVSALRRTISWGTQCADNLFRQVSASALECLPFCTLIQAWQGSSTSSSVMTRAELDRFDFGFECPISIATQTDESFLLARSLNGDESETPTSVDAVSSQPEITASAEEGTVDKVWREAQSMYCRVKATTEDKAKLLLQSSNEIVVQVTEVASEAVDNASTQLDWFTTFISSFPGEAIGYYSQRFMQRRNASSNRCIREIFGPLTSPDHPINNYFGFASRLRWLWHGILALPLTYWGFIVRILVCIAGKLIYWWMCWKHSSISEKKYAVPYNGQDIPPFCVSCSPWMQQPVHMTHVEPRYMKRFFAPSHCDRCSTNKALYNNLVPCTIFVPAQTLNIASSYSGAQTAKERDVHSSWVSAYDNDKFCSTASWFLQHHAGRLHQLSEMDLGVYSDHTLCRKLCSPFLMVDIKYKNTWRTNPKASPLCDFHVRPASQVTMVIPTLSPSDEDTSPSKPEPTPNSVPSVDAATPDPNFEDVAQQVSTMCEDRKGEKVPMSPSLDLNATNDKVITNKDLMKPSKNKEKTVTFDKEEPVTIATQPKSGGRPPKDKNPKTKPERVFHKPGRIYSELNRFFREQEQLGNGRQLDPNSNELMKRLMTRNRTKSPVGEKPTTRRRAEVRAERRAKQNKSGSTWVPVAQPPPADVPPVPPPALPPEVGDGVGNCVPGSSQSPAKTTICLAKELDDHLDDSKRMQTALDASCKFMAVKRGGTNIVTMVPVPKRFPVVTKNRYAPLSEKVAKDAPQLDASVRLQGSFNQYGNEQFNRAEDHHYFLPRQQTVISPGFENIDPRMSWEHVFSFMHLRFGTEWIEECQDYFDILVSLRPWMDAMHTYQALHFVWLQFRSESPDLHLWYVMRNLFRAFDIFLPRDGWETEEEMHDDVNAGDWEAISQCSTHVPIDESVSANRSVFARVDESRIWEDEWDDAREFQTLPFSNPEDEAERRGNVGPYVGVRVGEAEKPGPHQTQEVRQMQKILDDYNTHTESVSKQMKFKRDYWRAVERNGGLAPQVVFQHNPMRHLRRRARAMDSKVWRKVVEKAITGDKELWECTDLIPEHMRKLQNPDFIASESSFLTAHEAPEPLPDDAPVTNMTTFNKNAQVTGPVPILPTVFDSKDKTNACAGIDARTKVSKDPRTKRSLEYNPHSPAAKRLAKLVGFIARTVFSEREINRLFDKKFGGKTAYEIVLSKFSEDEIVKAVDELALYLPEFEDSSNSCMQPRKVNTKLEQIAKRCKAPRVVIDNGILLLALCIVASTVFQEGIYGHGGPLEKMSIKHVDRIRVLNRFQRDMAHPWIDERDVPGNVQNLTEDGDIVSPQSGGFLTETEEVELNESWKQGDLHPSCCWEIDQTGMENHERCDSQGFGILAAPYNILSKICRVVDGKLGAPFAKKYDIKLHKDVNTGMTLKFSTKHPVKGSFTLQFPDMYLDSGWSLTSGINFFNECTGLISCITSKPEKLFEKTKHGEYKISVGKHDHTYLSVPLYASLEATERTSFWVKWRGLFEGDDGGGCCSRIFADPRNTKIVEDHQADLGYACKLKFIIDGRLEMIGAHFTVRDGRVDTDVKWVPAVKRYMAKFGVATGNNLRPSTICARNLSLASMFAGRIEVLEEAFSNLARRMIRMMEDNATKQELHRFYTEKILTDGYTEIDRAFSDEYGTRGAYTLQKILDKRLGSYQVVYPLQSEQIDSINQSCELSDDRKLTPCDMSRLSLFARSCKYMDPLDPLEQEFMCRLIPPQLLD